MDSDIAMRTFFVTQEIAKWAYWSMIGTWVAGIATFGAAIVAFYLGLRPYLIKVKAKLCVRYTGDMSAAVMNENEFKVQLLVTNYSMSDVYIEDIRIVTGGIIQRNKVLSKLILGRAKDMLLPSKVRMRKQLKVVYRYVEHKPDASYIRPLKVAAHATSIVSFTGNAQAWIKKERESAKNYGFNYRKIAARIKLMSGKIIYSESSVDMDRRD